MFNDALKLAVQGNDKPIVYELLIRTNLSRDETKELIALSNGGIKELLIESLEWIRAFNQLVDISITTDKSLNVPTSFFTQINGKETHVYDAYVAKQEILLLTDAGTLTYVIDMYGAKPVIELYDWELSEE